MTETQGSLGTFGVVESLADRAYSQLFRAILRNELAPGTPLSVPELAQRMSISRSPVREAVQRLIYDGLAEHVLHRGAVVSRIDEAGFHDLLDVRELLEGLAARLAARRIDHGQLDELGTTLAAAHEATVSADDWYRSVELDIRFHAIIRTAACNVDLDTMLRRTQSRAHLSLHTLWQGPRDPHAMLAEHRAIYEAISLADSDLAEHKAQDHIRGLRARVAAFVGEERTGTVT